MTAIVDGICVQGTVEEINDLIDRRKKPVTVSNCDPCNKKEECQHMRQYKGELPLDCHIYGTHSAQT